LPRPRTKSTDVFGAYHIVKLPVYLINARPNFVRGAKRKIYDENGRVVFNGDNSTITLGFSLEKYLNEEIIRYSRLGHKKIKTRQMTAQLPILCPICDQRGNPVFQYDRRLRNKKWIERETPVVIWYYHGNRKHYYGTWKNGAVSISPKITDIRKTSVLYPWKMGLLPKS